MAFYTERSLKSKKFLGEKIYILAKDGKTESKLEIKIQNAHHLTKYLLPEKSSLLIFTSS